MPVTKLESSEARNNAALAISSESPCVPSDSGYHPRNGLGRLPVHQRCFGRARAEDVERMRRSFNSMVQRANENCGWQPGRAVNPEAGVPFDAADRARENDGAPVIQ